MPCTVTEVIGKGSNGIVYKAWYPDKLNISEKHYVLIKELFPYHFKGYVFRNEKGFITSVDDGIETYELHKKSFIYGNEIHLKLLEKKPDKIGANINTFQLNGTLYTVLGFSGGRSLDVELSSLKSIDLLSTAKRFLKLLECLSAFHETGFLHLRRRARLQHSSAERHV